MGLLLFWIVCAIGPVGPAITDCAKSLKVSQTEGTRIQGGHFGGHRDPGNKLRGEGSIGY